MEGGADEAAVAGGGSVFPPLQKGARGADSTAVPLPVGAGRTAVVASGERSGRGGAGWGGPVGGGAALTRLGWAAAAASEAAAEATAGLSGVQRLAVAWSSLILRRSPPWAATRPGASQLVNCGAHPGAAATGDRLEWGQGRARCSGPEREPEPAISSHVRRDVGHHFL